MKLGRGGAEILPVLENVSAPGFAFVILAGGDHPLAGEWAERFHRQGIAVFWEAVSVEEMHQGHRLGASGLILKGQEAGGRVGEETTFILLQRWRAEFGPQSEQSLPAWVQGGIGPNAAAASIACGATGVVLDHQLLLAKESSLRKSARQWLAAFDGSQTVCLGERLGEIYRLHKRPGGSLVEQLQTEEARLEAAELTAEEKRAAWREAVEAQIQARPRTKFCSWGNPPVSRRHSRSVTSPWREFFRRSQIAWNETWHGPGNCNRWPPSPISRIGIRLNIRFFRGR